MSQSKDPLHLAQALLNSGDAPAAEAALEGMTDPPAQELRARIRCERGEHLEAVRIFRALLAEKPSAEGYYRLGTCWQHLSQWDSSEKALLKAVNLDPRHTDAFILLGTALYQQDRPQDAIQAFERALVNDPQALLARYHLAQICTELGNYKRALSQLHVLQSLQPDYAPTHRLQAAIYLKLSDYRQALVELCWLVEAGHADAWCFSSMGQAYQAIGEKVQALRAYEFALKLDPSLIEETLAVARLNEELEQYEMALELYRSLIRDLRWGETARSAVDRLERRLQVLRLAAKPTADLPEFSGFKAPEVTQQGTLPLSAETRVATQPLGIEEVEYEGPPPLMERLKRNFSELAGGRLDLAELKDRSQALLDHVPLEALKERLDRSPLKRFFGGRGS